MDCRNGLEWDTADWKRTYLKRLFSPVFFVDQDDHETHNQHTVLRILKNPDLSCNIPLGFCHNTTSYKVVSYDNIGCQPRS